jgi:hypothetical protein
MLESGIILPTAIGSRVRIQSADRDAFNYLCWRGFQPEMMEINGWYVMRRDFHDAAFAHNPEPSPPRFSIDLLG